MYAFSFVSATSQHGKGCMDVVKHWCRNVQQFKKMFAIVQERKATACKEKK